MANSFTGRQWLIDTAFTTTKGTIGVPASVTPGGAAPVDLMMSNIKITQMEFTDYAAATDTVVVKDREGRTIWDGHGDTGLDPVRTGPIGWAQGFQVPSLAAGAKLSVYMST